MLLESLAKRISQESFNRATETTVRITCSPACHGCLTCPVQFYLPVRIRDTPICGLFDLQSPSVTTPGAPVPLSFKYMLE